MLSAPPKLESIAARVALFLDFDGTLVSLAPTPDAIEVAPGLAEGLERLAGQVGHRVALVSGRSLADLERHIGRPGIATAGSHGSERRTMTGEAIGEATGIPVEARKELRTFAANETQVSLEEKTLGLAVHYRGAPHLKDDVDMAAHDVATRYGLSVKRGKAVAEIVAKDAGKDGAVRLFMAKERFAGSLPVFIGDDVTDEDGFAAAEFFGGFGIVVGDREPTAARYRLADPAAVHAWLGLEGA